MDNTNKFIRPCTIVWLILIVLSVLAFTVGKLELSGSNIMSVIFISTIIKAQMVMDYFMGLKRVKWFWRGIMTGWLFLVMSLISIAYKTGL
jgi:cytochrome c oxidase subunit IV